jgi:GT2 family glycosyltransferase
MEEDYFLYYEELDWVERARRILPGVRLGYAVDSVILHQVGATIGTERRSLTSVRYLARSRLKFMRRFYPNYVWRTRLHLLWESLRETVRLRIPRAKVIFREATSRGSR